MAGCNSGGDTYNSGGQHVGGVVLKPSTVDPLDLDSPATQVALFVNQPVEGLSYGCDGVKAVKDTIRFVSQDNDTSATSLPVARCGNDAKSITFYLGKKDSLGASHNIELGQLFLPMATVGSDGNFRYNAAKGGISSASFMFDRSVSDMQSAPGRLDVTASFDNTEKCQTDKKQACELVYKTALLLALGKVSDDDVLVISARANTVAAHPEDYGINIPKGFDYASYSDFIAAWSTYAQAVRPGGVFPDLSDVLASINGGAKRLRAGTYTLDWGGSFKGYMGYYNSCYLYNLLALNSDWLVYPDGTISGFGYGASDTKYAAKICPAVKSPEELVAVLASSKRGFLAVSSGTLGNNLSLQNVSMTAVDSKQIAKLDFFGRFFGGFLYDGREPQVLDKVKITDFKLDFPKAKTSLTDAEKGSVTGELFDFNLPDYAPGGKVGVTEDRGSFTPTPFPLRMVKGAALQAMPLDSAVIAKLPDNYAIQLMRFCGSNDAGCNAIPAADIGAGANYPKTVCTLTSKNSINKDVCENEVTIKKEIAKRNIATDTSNADDVVHLYFDKSAVSDSVIVELADQNGDPVLNSASGKPIRLGFVTATPKSTDVSDDTVDIHLLFASTDAATMPQLGSTLSGRIDLSANCMPIYRLGDANYTSKVRARWVDSFGYAAHIYRERQNIKISDKLTAKQSERITSLSAGAVKGWNPDVAGCPAP